MAAGDASPAGRDGSRDDAMSEPHTHPPGQAPVKREYIRTFAAFAPAAAPVDDDAAEAGGTKEPAQAASAEQPRKRQCAPHPRRLCPPPVPDAQASLSVTPLHLSLASWQARHE